MGPNVPHFMNQKSKGAPDLTILSSSSSPHQEGIEPGCEMKSENFLNAGLDFGSDNTPFGTYPPTLENRYLSLGFKGLTAYALVSTQKLIGHAQQTDSEYVCMNCWAANKMSPSHFLAQYFRRIKHFASIRMDDIVG